MIKSEKGLWYIVVTCEKCTSTVFLFEDLTEGKGSLEANYIVSCPRCAHKGGYQARHYFHADGEKPLEKMMRNDFPLSSTLPAEEGEGPAQPARPKSSSSRTMSSSPR